MESSEGLQGPFGYGVSCLPSDTQKLLIQGTLSNSERLPGFVQDFAARGSFGSENRVVRNLMID
jgi:hypothetical protein